MIKITYSESDSDSIIINIINYQLSIINYQLSIINYQLSIINLLFFLKVVNFIKDKKHLSTESKLEIINFIMK